ncbi:MAG: hypothetical protein ABI442_19530 [Gemmatimonadaceae bacterium]
MPSTTWSHRDEATFLRAALLLGLIKGDVAIAWADGLVHHDPSPSAELLELSLTPAADLSAVRHALWPLAHPAESPDVIRRLIAVAAVDYTSGKRSFADTIQVLRQRNSPTCRRRRHKVCSIGSDAPGPAIYSSHALDSPDRPRLNARRSEPHVLVRGTHRRY